MYRNANTHRFCCVIALYFIAAVFYKRSYRNHKNEQNARKSNFIWRNPGTWIPAQGQVLELPSLPTYGIEVLLHTFYF